MADSDSFILNDEEVVKLAKVVYNQEAEAAKHCKCNSEVERSNCIHETKVCYNTVLGLLESVRQLKKEFEDKDKDLFSIAYDIASYVVYSANFAVQFVSNYNLRRHYLDKIKEHVNELITALRKIDPKKSKNYVAEVRRLAIKANAFRNDMMEYVRQKTRPVSRYYAKWVKDTGLSFGHLVKRQMSKFNFQGPFRKLKDAQKLQVYNSIIRSSGRGNIKVTQGTKAQGAVGMAVLIFTAGMVVWDVYTSDNKLQTATENAAQVLGALGGGTLAEFAATALATGLLGAAASPVFVVVAGIVGGFAGSYIIGKFAVSLVDKVFGWGETDTVTHMCDEICMHQCCVATAPAGNVLARSIARRRDEL